ncbi:MAG: hypothetical protein WC812_02310 [Candidatus Pacearchaeota archaeon]|jgi:hypothetical protein
MKKDNSKEKNLKQKKPKKKSNIKVLKSSIKIKEEKQKEIDLTIEKPKKQGHVQSDLEEINDVQFLKFLEKNTEVDPVILEKIEETPFSKRLEKQVFSDSSPDSFNNSNENSKNDFSYSPTTENNEKKYSQSSVNYVEHMNPFHTLSNSELQNLGKNNPLIETKKVMRMESEQANLVKDLHVEKYTVPEKFKSSSLKDKNKNLGQEVKYTPSQY